MLMLKTTIYIPISISFAVVLLGATKSSATVLEHGLPLLDRVVLEHNPERAQGIIETREPNVIVSSSRLLDILCKIRSLEKEVNQLLANSHVDKPIPCPPDEDAMACGESARAGNVGYPPSSAREKADYTVKDFKMKQEGGFRSTIRPLGDELRVLDEAPVVNPKMQESSHQVANQMDVRTSDLRSFATPIRDAGQPRPFLPSHLEEHWPSSQTNTRDTAIREYEGGSVGAEKTAIALSANAFVTPDIFSTHLEEPWPNSPASFRDTRASTWDTAVGEYKGGSLGTEKTAVALSSDPFVTPGIFSTHLEESWPSSPANPWDTVVSEHEGGSIGTEKTAVALSSDPFVTPGIFSTHQEPWSGSPANPWDTAVGEHEGGSIGTEKTAVALNANPFVTPAMFITPADNPGDGRIQAATPFVALDTNFLGPTLVSMASPEDPNVVFPMKTSIAEGRFSDLNTITMTITGTSSVTRTITRMHTMWPSLVATASVTEPLVSLFPAMSTLGTQTTKDEEEDDGQDDRQDDSKDNRPVDTVKDDRYHHHHEDEDNDDEDDDDDDQGIHISMQYAFESGSWGSSTPPNENPPPAVPVGAMQRFTNSSVKLFESIDGDDAILKLPKPQTETTTFGEGSESTPVSTRPTTSLHTPDALMSSAPSGFRTVRMRTFRRGNWAN
ncbi:hypothetical protein HIM_04409 [Hirsutella minnesotensis 3608]|uniref:Uncharacterized protein n=1 Tax=Hirsutella minnesotensis 3608 TaxID=1043627 RepID=A0A0F8A1M0_9HYPO|nr:hypothetical protein HIM_04409 [Hirsutella minnesotensis 3608]